MAKMTKVAKAAHLRASKSHQSEANKLQDEAGLDGLFQPDHRQDPGLSDARFRVHRDHDAAARYHQQAADQGTTGGLAKTARAVSQQAKKSSSAYVRLLKKEAQRLVVRKKRR